METVGVVDGLDEVADLASGVFDRGVGFGVHLLGFERLHETFGLGIVVRIGHPAHAGGDLARLQTLGVVAASILHAPVRVMDQTVRSRIARHDRHVQRLNGEPGLQMIVERPADDLARERVEHDRQIDESLAEPDIGDVGDPYLIEPSGPEAARQIRHDREAMPAVGGVWNEGFGAQAQQIVRDELRLRRPAPAQTPDGLEFPSGGAHTQR